MLYIRNLTTALNFATLWRFRLPSHGTLLACHPPIKVIGTSIVFSNTFPWIQKSLVSHIGNVLQTYHNGSWIWRQQSWGRLRTGQSGLLCLSVSKGLHHLWLDQVRRSLPTPIWLTNNHCIGARMLSYGSIPVSIPIRPVPVSEICHKTLAPKLTRQSSGSYKYLPELLNTHFRYCAQIPQCTPGSSRTILSVSCGRPCSVWQMEEHSCNSLAQIWKEARKHECCRNGHPILESDTPSGSLFLAWCSQCSLMLFREW